MSRRFGFGAGLNFHSLPIDDDAVSEILRAKTGAFVFVILLSLGPCFSGGILLSRYS